MTNQNGGTMASLYGGVIPVLCVPMFVPVMFPFPMVQPFAPMTQLDMGGQPAPEMRDAVPENAGEDRCPKGRDLDTFPCPCHFPCRIGVKRMAEGGVFET